MCVCVHEKDARLYVHVHTKLCVSVCVKLSVCVSTLFCRCVLH